MKDKTAKTVLAIVVVLLMLLNGYSIYRNNVKQKQLAEIENQLIELKKDLDFINKLKDKYKDAHEKDLQKINEQQSALAEALKKAKQQLKEDEQAIIDYPADFDAKFDILARNLAAD